MYLEYCYLFLSNICKDCCIYLFSLVFIKIVEGVDEIEGQVWNKSSVEPDYWRLFIWRYPSK